MCHQVDIFGTKTPGEAKTLERNIVDAERTPPNAVEKERLLLKAADKNCYEKALLIMQMAAFQPVLMKRQHLLQVASPCARACTARDAAGPLPSV